MSRRHSRLARRLPSLLLNSISSIGVVSAQAPPVVADGGVLNAASLVKGQPVSLGAFVAIFGSGFGNGGVAPSSPRPTSLGGAAI
jgi:hypothetical protein